MTRLELTWPNKDRFLLVPKDEEGKPVWVDRDHPAAAEIRVTDFVAAVGEVSDNDRFADNLLFTGDSLDVLRILTEVPEYRRIYRGKVKQVYIDPPFNTGQAFDHYDDWLAHATWLSFMRERLLLIRDLLSPEGSVWVHLDEVEQHRMRALLGEVFGERGFIGTVVWQKRTSRENRAAFSESHDFITVFSPMPAAEWRHVRNRLPRSDSATNPDHDPRGPWDSVPFTAQGTRTNQMYPITTPTGSVLLPPKGRCWGATEPEFLRLLEKGRIYFPRGGEGRPRVKQYADEGKGLVPHTIWTAKEVGDNELSATAEN